METFRPGVCVFVCSFGSVASAVPRFNNECGMILSSNERCGAADTKLADAIRFPLSSQMLSVMAYGGAPALTCQLIPSLLARKLSRE